MDGSRLTQVDPIPPGLATLLLARAGISPAAIGETFGLSPVGRKNLVEGVSPFSPFKTKLLAESCGTTEEWIFAVSRLVTDKLEDVDLQGQRREHPFLGEVQVLECFDRTCVIRTKDGRILRDVAAICLMTREEILRSGIDLTPEKSVDQEDTGSETLEDLSTEITGGSLSQESEDVPPGADGSDEPAQDSSEETSRRDARDVLREHAEASGKSRSEISREMGMHRAFLSGVLSRGRSFPIGRLADFAIACGSDPEALAREIEAASGDVFRAPDTGKATDGPTDRSSVALQDVDQLRDLVDIQADTARMPSDLAGETEDAARHSKACVLRVLDDLEADLKKMSGSLSALRRLFD